MLLRRRIADVVVLALGARAFRRARASARRAGLPAGWQQAAVRRLAGRSGRVPRSSLRNAVRVAAIRLLVESLDGAAATELVAGLTDTELQAWHDRLARLPPSARDPTYVAVGERVALPQWRRFGLHTDDIDPDPSGDLRDLARLPDPLPDEVAQALRWERWEGPLAARGVDDGHAYHANDVVQGHIGNCYLIAALQALANVAPDRLARLCRGNTNGTWTVTLPSRRRTVVSPDVVVDVHGAAVFARRPGDGEVELWPMLLEKAYAQLHGGWAEIVGGHTDDAVQLLTGIPGHVVPGRELDVAYLGRWWRARATMVCKTIPVPAGRTAVEWLATDAPALFRRPGRELLRLHPNHAFVVRDVDEGGGFVTLANPWGIEDGAVVLDEHDLRTCIHSLHVTELD